MTIAAAMIIGGVLTIVLAAISGVGLAAIGISLAAAIFFFLMESVYSTYDSSFVFQKLRDFFYERSNESAWANDLKVGFDNDFSSDDPEPEDLESLVSKPQKSRPNKPNLELEDNENFSDFEGFPPDFQEPEPKTNSVLVAAWNMMLKRMKIQGSSSPELRFVESD